MLRLIGALALKFIGRAFRALLPPALLLAAGWYCLDLAQEDPRKLVFWPGLAAAAAGVYGLFLAVGQVKRLEAARIGEATGLKFRRAFWLITLDHLEMDGVYEGREVELVNSGGGARRGISDEVSILVRSAADPGFRLAVYPAGLLNRPFGFFPPRLPLTSAGGALVLRGSPEGPARTAAERLLGEAPELRRPQFRLLRVTGAGLRLEFRRNDAFYEPREMRRLLNVAVRAARALGV